MPFEILKRATENHTFIKPRIALLFMHKLTHINKCIVQLWYTHSFFQCVTMWLTFVDSLFLFHSLHFVRMDTFALTDNPQIHRRHRPQKCPLLCKSCVSLSVCNVSNRREIIRFIHTTHTHICVQCVQSNMKCINDVTMK